MELKIGKDKDIEKSSLIDVAETKSDIRFNRSIVAILKDDYEEAVTNEEKRDIGIAINSINDEIKSLRDKLREKSLDSVVSVQKLEAELDTARGELSKYLNIDQSKVDDVLREFGGRYYEMHDVRSETERKLETAVGGEERTLQGEIDVLNAAILQVEIVNRNEMIEGFLPAAKGIDSAEDVAEWASSFAKEKKREWFDNGDIREDSLKIIKYGRPVSIKYEPIPGTDELEEIKEERIVGVIEHNIDERKDAVRGVGGVWTKIKDTDKLKGKPISFSPQELKNLVGIKTPDEMIARINALCTVNQRKAFSDALGEVDEKGHILYSEGIVCNVNDQEIRDAFDRMKELEDGVRGSGYEYMRRFLNIMFKYGAFEDDVYDELANYDSVVYLLDRIKKEIRSCSCAITDVHEDEVERAFADKAELEREHKGKGVAFMNRALRNIFNCDTFEDHTYGAMAEYENPEELVGRINAELSEVGVYDKDSLKYAIKGINRRAVLSKMDAEKQLDDVFGDHFTKPEYEEAAKHVTSEDSVVDSNREALIIRFRSIGDAASKIRVGKTLEGITNEDYNKRWDKERKKMFKHGETKKIEAIIKQRQVEAAQKQFNNLVDGIGEDTMLSQEELRHVFESVDMKPHVIATLLASVTDIEDVVDDNLKRLSVSMKNLIKKHDMYEEDIIFNEGSVYSAVGVRRKMELGDSTGALEHMKASILKSVGKLDMSKYGESITDSASEKINRDYGDIDEESLADMPEDDITNITKQFSRRIQKYKDDANKSMKTAEEIAIGDLYAGRIEEDDVYVPPEFSRGEMEREHKLELDKARREAMKAVITDDIPGRLEPFLSIAEIDDYTDAIPKKPKKPKTKQERAKMAWWESFMEKSEPVFERTQAFNNANLALVMRKGIGKKYVVYGEGGESAGFLNLKELDKWFKTHYGKSNK